MTPLLLTPIMAFMKIVIVDDESDICLILNIELKALGHETVSFGSVPEAMEYLKKNQADCILCDFQMPRQSGLDLFKWLNVNNKHIPFYILTGEPTMETKELLAMGIKDILFKPQDLLKLSSIFK